MTITKHQASQFANHMLGYHSVGFAPGHCRLDHATGLPVVAQASGYAALENDIGAGLNAADPETIREAIAGVTWWGWSRTPLAHTRTNRFLARTPVSAILQFRDRPRPLHRGERLRVIRDCGLNQYSQISFISKLVTFDDPAHCGVLDKKIAGLRAHIADAGHPLRRLVTQGSGDQLTSIPVNGNNMGCYEDYCARLVTIASSPLLVAALRERGWTRWAGSVAGRVMAADVERGLFHCIDSGQPDLAAAILA